MISCRNLTKRFGSLVALDRVSFEVTGGICAVLGSNGAGKSTLLKLLTGLLRPDEGSIGIGTADVSKHLPDVKRMIGVVPEDLGLLESLTVREHLELSGRVYGLNKDQIRHRTENLAQALGLREALDTFLENCSQGTRKKTALAMALLHNPHTLLLDEPFEGTDPVSSRAIQQLFTSMSRRGATILFVAHSLAVVTQVASQVIMLQRGRLVWNSPVSAMSRPMEEMYFDLVETPAPEALSWLDSSRS
jgi:ABC-2 type transport system ATP-binding protein